MSCVRTKHPDLQIIMKAELDADLLPDLKTIKFSLPKKASKLEKFLLKLAEMYSYDVLRNNLYNDIISSPEYAKLRVKLAKKK